MHQRQRLQRISQQLNKLNSLIQFTKNESIIARQALKDCHDSSSFSSSLSQQDDISHNISQMFDGADSRSTILIASNNNDFPQFLGSNSLEMSRPLQGDKIEREVNSRSHLEMQGSILSSSQNFKQSTVQISQIHPIDTTVKKAKLLKTNLGKNKKSNFQKQQRANSKNQKMDKIYKIKSENKLISNTSTFKRGINLIKEQFQTRNSKTKTSTLFAQNSTLPAKNYLSNKIQTLNSKRNVKYNSVTKPADRLEKGKEKEKHNYNDKEKQKQKEKLEKHHILDKNHNLDKTGKNSRNKFHINLQKQVTMKITDLKIKKNLCLVQTSYLSASVKIIKDQINQIQDASSKYSDQTLLKYFILKSIIKFISQYNDETWTNSQDIQIDNQTVTNTIKKPEKFIKIINKLPDILRRRNIVSESICKQFIEDKSFIQQKVNNLSGCKMFQKEPLYIYLCQLHLYIQFLLNNSMIHQTKRHKIFNPTSEEFFSDRSTKEGKHMNAGKEGRFQSKNKDLSQRKKVNNVTTLKRVNTSKALKKGMTATKPKKV